MNGDNLPSLIALGGVWLFGGWLTAIGILCAAAPHKALYFLSRMASSHRINITEQTLRMLAGIALVVRGPDASAPGFFAAAGWFTIVTSALLLVIPLRWHAGYSIWWSQRMPVWAVRALAPVAVAAGAGLIVAAH